MYIQAGRCTREYNGRTTNRKHQWGKDTTKWISLCSVHSLSVVGKVPLHKFIKQIKAKVLALNVLHND
ncbi:hypothetical protein FKM82_023424 [Ascaphus truei]